MTNSEDKYPIRRANARSIRQAESKLNLNIATTKNDDQAIWYGDVVEIQLATDAHSYYQLAINPAGALVDLDRGAPRSQRFNWSSQAEVATHIADDHWTVEVRIPTTRDANDPLHQVIGHKPTQSLPWHINVCRQRVRGNGTEHSAFSPTAASGFHVPMKFAHFHAGRSHRFQADTTVKDYVIDFRAAEKLQRDRKWQTAGDAYLAIAQQKKITDLQKSRALQHAAQCAVGLEDFEQANELAEQIPIEAVKKTTRMQILGDQRKWSEIVSRFGGEELASWPFWQIGEGALGRGKANYFTKSAKQADTDLRLALRYESDSRVQTGIRTIMAQNCEFGLGDDAEALKLYRQNVAGKRVIGAADEFRSVAGAAKIPRQARKIRRST